LFGQPDGRLRPWFLSRGFKLGHEFFGRDAGSRIVGRTQNPALQQFLSQIRMLLQLPSFMEKNEDSFRWIDEHALLNPVKEPESEFGG